MALGLAWHARRLGTAGTAAVPESAPEAKLSAITRLGADYLKVPFDRWWQVMADRSYPAPPDRLFIHPFAGQPTPVDYAPSFVDGIGSRSVFGEMLPPRSPGWPGRAGSSRSCPAATSTSASWPRS